MKKLLSIFFLLLYYNVQAGHFTFGTPGSSASLTSMTGHSMGDTAYIAPGTYTFLDAQHLDSIHILPLDPNNLPVFQQTSHVWANRWIEIGFMRFIWASGSGIGWQENGSSTTSYHNNYHDLYFSGFSSSVFSCHNNNLYVPGDTTKLVSYMDTYHDIITDSCGQFFQASFGSISSNAFNPPDVFDSTTFYNIQDIATSLQGGNGQGTGIRGIFFRLTVHDVYITDRSGRGADGDVGWIYLTGGAYHAYRIFKWGGPGYDIRCNDPMSEVNHPFDCWFYNSGKLFGTQYGLINVQAILGDTLAGKFYIPNDYNWNLALGKQTNDTLGYWSPLMNMGQTMPNGHHYGWNILGFDIGENPQKVGHGPNLDKNQLWVNLGGWANIGTDTTKGRYFRYATNVSLDSATSLYSNRIGVWPLYQLTSASPASVLHGGVVGQIITPTADFLGSFPRNTPDLGYLQLLPSTYFFNNSIIPYNNPDFRAPGRTAEQWNNYGAHVDIPTQGAFVQPMDVYYRFQWYQIETGNRVYDWSLFDQQINAAIDNGQKFSFGVMPVCPFCGGPQVGGALLGYPAFLHTLMQAEAQPDWITPQSTMWVPNWNSNNYLTAVENFCTDLNTHLNNTTHNGIFYKDVISQIDIRHYGAFGEWHAAFIINTTSDYPAGTQPTSATLKRIIDAYKNGLPNFQLQVMIGAFDGNYLANTMNPPDVGVYSLQSRNTHGLFGWRRDQWGDLSTYLNNFLELNTRGSGTLPQMKDSIMIRYLQAPITGEPTFQASYPGLEGQISFYHALSFGNGNFSFTPGANAASDTFRAASKRSGYRFLIDSGNISFLPKIGAPFTIALNWQNLGVSTTYENWNVQYEIRTLAGVTVWTGTSHFTPHYFQPQQTDSTVIDTYNLTGFPAGNYNLFVIIRDPNGYRKPLPLAITNQQADGSYVLRSNFLIATTSGHQPPNAIITGPSSITLPTNSITLDGTSSFPSSGSIVSYQWSTLSGPNSPTITTPNTSTTTVSNLIAGTYSFQLKVTDDSAAFDTASISVLVNPQPNAAANVFTNQTPPSNTGNDGPQGGIVGIETGMKFRSSVPGFITGVRFYKTVGNTGSHVGELYSRTGTRLAQASYTNETASGWQTVTFSSPVAILANTTYITAYFSPVGNYGAGSAAYFNTAVTNVPLTGLATGTDGGNGLFLYTANPAVPTNTFNAGNYWVDVVFTTNPPVCLGCLPGRKFSHKKNP